MIDVLEMDVPELIGLQECRKYGKEFKCNAYIIIIWGCMYVKGNVHHGIWAESSAFILKLRVARLLLDTS